MKQLEFKGMEAKAHQMIEWLRCVYHSRQHDFVIKNFFIDSWECDLFSVTKSGYTNEYEIKVSRADYKNDFKKGSKHYFIENGKRTNKFWFVVPKDLIHVDEIPKYAGLIYIDRSCIYVIKNAPLLHKRRLLSDIFYLRTIANKCYGSYLDINSKQAAGIL